MFGHSVEAWAESGRTVRLASWVESQGQDSQNDYDGDPIGEVGATGSWSRDGLAQRAAARAGGGLLELGLRLSCF